MADVQSNFPEIERVIQAIADSFNFERPGREQSLGRDALGVVTTSIQDRCRNETDPEGNRWAPNKEWAQKDPRKRGKPVGILGDSDNMLAPLQIQGEQDVTSTQAEVTYGTDEWNRRKAQWFTNGSRASDDGTERSGADNQEARPFYEIGEAEERALDEFFDAELDRYLREL